MKKKTDQTSRTKEIDARWLAYTLAGGATLALQPGAQGDIVWSGTQTQVLEKPATSRDQMDLSFIPPGSAFPYMQFDAFAPDPHAPSHSFRNGFRLGSSPVEVLREFVVIDTYYGSITNVSNQARLFEAGYEISGDSPGWSSAGAGADFARISTIGQDPYTYEPITEVEGWAGQRGYLAARFSFDGWSAPWNYGWIDVEIDEDVTTLTVHSWAYAETQDEAIELGMIPEPGTLAMLAAGAGGLLAWRRRNRRN